MLPGLQFAVCRLVTPVRHRAAGGEVIPLLLDFGKHPLERFENAARCDVQRIGDDVVVFVGPVAEAADHAGGEEFKVLEAVFAHKEHP